MLNIRKMTIDDYDQVYDIWLKSGNGLNDIDDSKTGIEKYLQRNPDTCFVAENDSGTITGAVLCGYDGRRGFINNMAVLASERKKGVGTSLINAVTNACKAKGITKIAMVVFAHNAPGNAFWEKRGFKLRNDLVYRDKALTEMAIINDNFKF